MDTLLELHNSSGVFTKSKLKLLLLGNSETARLYSKGIVKFIYFLKLCFTKPKGAQI